MRRGALAALVVASLLLATPPLHMAGASGVAADNDDPFGADAPDWPDLAWTLNWSSTYSGGINGSDADWYFLNATPVGGAVEFTLDGSAPWDLRVAVLDANRSLLGTAHAGTHNVRTNTDALYFGLRSETASTWTLSAKNTTLVPQDDTGAGGDAPGTAGKAVAIGTITPVLGQLEPPFIDGADWYRLTVPSGHYLAVNATPDPGTTASVQVRETDQTILSTWGIPTWRTWTEIDHQGQEVLLGVRSGLVPNDYTIQLQHRPRPDVAVTDVNVSDPVVANPEVHVTVANQGLGKSQDGWLRVWAEHPTMDRGGPTVIMDRPIKLAWGESRTLTRTWDTTGSLGEATIHARITSAFDNAPGNDAASATTHVLVPMSGVGVDV